MLLNIARTSTHPRLIKNLYPLSGHQFRAFSETLQSSYTTLLTSTHENNASASALSVGLITLNQPKSLNSLSDALFKDLIHASRAFDAMDEIGAIVVTGNGKAFAAGADIPEMSEKDFATAYNTVRMYYYALLILLYFL